jgi:hypothetical protein
MTGLLPQARVSGYGQVPPRLKSSQPAADHEGFFAAVGEVIGLQQQSQAVPSQWNLKYVAEYPKSREGAGFDQPFDIVLHRVISSRMADGAGGRVPKGLSRFDERPAPNKARYHQIIEGWLEDTVVEFQVLSKSNQTANQVAVWLHRCLMEYAYRMKFFLARGVQNFRFVGRLEDDVTKEFGQDLYRRRLQYSFRIIFLLNYEAKDLESIHLELRSLAASGEASPVQSFDWSIDDGPQPQG